LPDPEFDESDIKSKLGQTLGLSDREIVALFGYRTLGFLSHKKKNEEIRWSMNPYVFDNNYYKELLKPENKYYIKTPSDKALLNNSQWLEFVEEFAKDQEAFFNEFTNVYIKLGRLGHNNLKPEVTNVNFNLSI